MMQLTFKILIALLTFYLGTICVWQSKKFFYPEIEVYSVTEKLQPINIRKNDIPILPDGKIEVEFKEFIALKDGLELRFKITNYKDESVFFSGYSDSETTMVEPAVAFTKVNGKQQKEFFCTNGSEQIELKPSESIEFNLWGGFLSRHLFKGNKFQMGFGFQIGNSQDYKMFWSENLPISKSIKKQLLREAKEREKYY